MDSLADLGARIGACLKERGQTIAVAESSSGGLVCATLLAVPGASHFFLGGAVVYTRQARQALLGITPADMEGLRPASEVYAALLADTVKARHGADWGLGETGAAGPTGNRYGDPAGHTCVAITGPSSEALTIRTASADRSENMQAFAGHALAALARALERQGH